MIHVFKIALLSPRKVHLRIHSQLLLRILPLLFLLFGAVVGQLMPENRQLVEVGLTEAVDYTLDVRFAFDVGEALGLQNGEHLVKRSFDGFEGVVAHVALDQD